MPDSVETDAPRGSRTEITCSKCGKAASVPFAPTPGRPVFCRDCFAARGPSGPTRSSPGPRGTFGAPRAATPRQRMMAQGRKGHFIHDARSLLGRTEGGMEDQHVRAFLEGLFARGARTSTQAALEFLEEKIQDGTVTREQGQALASLVDRYSFWR